jgi:DNA modification methylase
MADWQVIQGDCLEVMRGMTENSVDSIVTDPPYGIGYASAWQTRLGGEARRNGASFGKDEFNASWILEAYRLLRNDTLLYCFTRWDVIGKWRDAFEEAGFHAIQRLVWDKCHWKMGDLRYYGSQTEDVLLLRKGTPTMFPGGRGRRGNLFRHSAAFLPEGQFDHPTQKPVALMATYIEDSTKYDAIVLDPFMGSGTTGVAAIKTDRNFIGIEMSGEYCAIARARIAEAAMQKVLL